MLVKHIIELEEMFIPTVQCIGLKEIKRYESGRFGSGYIQYKLNGILIRLVNDRGYSAIDIGRDTDDIEWFNLSLAINYIDSNDIMSRNNFSDLMDFLTDNYMKLIDMFTNKYDETVSVLHPLKKEFATRALDEAHTGRVQDYWRTGKI